MAAPDIHSDDFYHVLGVEKSATPDEIKRAYLGLVREYTPERSPEVFKRIRQAYETLSDPGARDRYDARPNPRIEALVNEAAEAMKAQDFSKAEQLYKQALLDAPGLDWVRNLLGICFLYQKRPLDAIAQYERVLQQPTLDASMHANLAHAYAMVRRFDDAQREFKIAMSLAGERGFEYGIGLIEMVADSSGVDAADRLVQELVKSEPKGSPAIAAYYSKQIELALRLNRRHSIPAIVLRMTQGLETDAEKRIVAGALGSIGSRLIASELFDIAERVAKTAATLQPDDPGFDALEYAGRLLHGNDFDAAARLLRTHVSFAPGGAVHGLRPWIEHYLATHAAFKGMQQISTPPTVFRLYGIGTTVFGERDYDEQTKSHVVTQYFTVFFIPLFPVANYRVREEGNRVRYYLGRIPLRDAQKVHIWGVVGLILFLIVLAQTGGSSTSANPISADDSTGQVESLPIGSTAATDTTLRLTQYYGEMADTTQSITPVRSLMRLSFANLSTSSIGYLTVFPPLTGTGPYTLRARRDSVRLSTVAGSDTILFIGKRVGGNAITGTYGMVGPETSRRYGRWQLHLVRGAPIPAQLNPW